jgi:hypothetical protein
MTAPDYCLRQLPGKGTKIKCTGLAVYKGVEDDCNTAKEYELQRSAKGLGFGLIWFGFIVLIYRR